MNIYVLLFDKNKVTYSFRSNINGQILRCNKKAIAKFESINKKLPSSFEQIYKFIHARSGIEYLLMYIRLKSL